MFHCPARLERGIPATPAEGAFGSSLPTTKSDSRHWIDLALRSAKRDKDEAAAAAMVLVAGVVR